jgi:hypothetical protein
MFGAEFLKPTRQAIKPFAFASPGLCAFAFYISPFSFLIEFL